VIREVMPMSLADKRIEWKARFDAWKSSGLSVAEWCREQGIKDHQMYYWIRIFEDDVAPKQESNTQWLTVNVNDESRHHIEEPLFILVQFLLKYVQVLTWNYCPM